MKNSGRKFLSLVFLITDINDISNKMQKPEIFIFSAALFLFSCKKEQAALPYNDIERFTVEAPDGSSLKGSITNNEIIVYWPPLVNKPDSIIPQITISDGAQIRPASGTTIPFKDGVSFTVTAANGTARTYTLRAGSNQPVPVFEVASADYLRIGKNIDVVGEYFLRDTVKTKLYLIDKNGITTQLPGNSFTVFYSAHISAPIPYSIDSGYYHVKLESGVRTVMHGPYYINIPYLTEFAIADAGKNKKPGETVEITYGGHAAKYYHKKFGNSKAVLSVQTANGIEQVTVAISKTADGKLSFIIPDKAPGKILLISINDEAGNLLIFWEAPSGSEINITEPT